MRRLSLTALGFTVVTVAAVLFAKSYMRPTQEKVQREQKVLTDAYRPQLLECMFLEDTDLPPSLRRPEVDEDLAYVQVTILYPGVDAAPTPDQHVLEEVNGAYDTKLRPVHTSTETGVEGTFLFLVFRTDHAFEAARMTRDGMRLFGKVALD